MHGDLGSDGAKAVRTPKLIARATDQATRSQGRREDGRRPPRRSGIRRAIVAALVVLAYLGGSAAAAFAQQLVVKHYTNADGLPQAQVLSAFHDSRGYMWFGTYGGVARFDGSVFLNYTSSDGLAGNVVVAIAEDESGRMFFGTDDGVTVLENGGFQELEGPEKDSILSVQSIYADGGEVWIATENGLFQHVESTVVRYDEDDGLPSASVFAVTRDRGGYLWVGTGRGLARRDGERFVPVSDGVPPNTTVRTIIEDVAGLWIGTENGLYRWAEESFRRVEDDVFDDPDANFVVAATVDTFDGVWLATRAGAVHYHNGIYSLLTHANGLVDGEIQSLTTDREGHIWFGTDYGTSKFVPGPFTGYNASDGLPNNFVRDIAEDEDGRIWAATRFGVGVVEPDGRVWALGNEDELGTRIYGVTTQADGSVLIGTRERGLYHWDDGALRRYTTADGLPSDFVRVLERGRSGQVWIGTDAGLATWTDGRIQTVLTDMDNSELNILDVYEDEGNRLWVAIYNGLLVFDGERFERYETSYGLDDISIWSLAPDGAGGIWAGTNGLGAYYFGPKGDRRLSTDDGLSNDFVWQIFVDDEERLWLYTNRGLDRWDGTSFTHFDLADGLLDLEGSTDAVLQDRDRNLWFGTGRGLVKYTSAHERELDVAPLVNIESATVGGEPMLPASEGEEVEVRYTQDPITFSYSGLTFHDETATQHRYRLLGLSDEWSPLTSERSVSYAQLSPGRYTFEVESWNGHGVRSEAPAHFSFTVAPGIFQTMWLRALAGLSLAGLVFAVYWGRHRHVELEKRRLEATVRVRTSELAMSEERMRTALRNSPTFVFSQDSELRYTWVHNPILDLKPEDVLGSSDADLLDPETAQELTAIKQGVLETGKGLRQQIIVRRGEMDRHLDLTIEPLREDDEIVGVTGAAWDVSKQVDLEKQLRQSQKLEAVGQLAGGVAHDFNNLLTGITGYTQLALAHLSADSPAAGECKNVLDCSKRAAQLTQQLLAFSRRQPLEFDVLNPNELIGRISTLLHRVIGEDVELVVACSPELSNVRADAGQIEQVLMNLAVNARDAMPDGGKLVIATSDVVFDSKTAQRYAGAPSGAYARIAVTDTGTGMGRATREHAFEPFFTTKEVGRGTGLGLATVYGIVKQHEGFVYIHSEVGEGTTVEVFLPPTEETADAQQGKVEAAMPGGGETILLVEDEKAVRDVTSRWLENLGYKIYAAADPDEAGVIYESHAEEIDLLFTDVVMPRSSGPELYKSISEKQASLRVLYMSGYANRGGTSHDLNRPGIEFLQKPFSLDELANKVRSVLDDSVAA